MKCLRTPEHKHLMKRLVSARKKLDLTRAELARKLGGQQNFVSRYETGESKLTWLAVAPVSKALRVTAHSVSEMADEHGALVDPKLRKAAGLPDNPVDRKQEPARKRTAKGAHRSRRKARSTAA